MTRPNRTLTTLLTLMGSAALTIGAASAQTYQSQPTYQYEQPTTQYQQQYQQPYTAPTQPNTTFQSVTDPVYQAPAAPVQNYIPPGNAGTAIPQAYDNSVVYGAQPTTQVQQPYAPPTYTAPSTTTQGYVPSPPTGNATVYAPVPQPSAPTTYIQPGYTNQQPAYSDSVYGNQPTVVQPPLYAQPAPQQPTYDAQKPTITWVKPPQKKPLPVPTPYGQPPYSGYSGPSTETTGITGATGLIGGLVGAAILGTILSDDKDDDYRKKGNDYQRRYQIQEARKQEQLRLERLEARRLEFERIEYEKAQKKKLLEQRRARRLEQQQKEQARLEREARRAQRQQQRANRGDNRGNGNGRGITLYEHCDYKGHSVTIRPGVYDLAELERLGLKNDDISSVRVGNSVIAHLYEHDGLQGNRLTLDKDAKCLVGRNFNDILSSIIVDRL